MGHELEVSVRKGAVELVKEAGSSGLSVRVIRDGCVATSSTTDLQPDAVVAFLRRAVEMATVSEPDPMAAPPAKRELAKTWPTLALFDPVTDGIDADQAIALATKAEAVAMRADRRITASEGASFGRSSGHSVLATTGGFLGERAGTYQSLVVQAVADDAGGKKRNGVYWSGGRFFAELESPEAVGKEAARRALEQLGAIKLDTCVMPVVFDKDAARGIVGLLAGCVLGDSIYRERSYLARKLGERVASKHVTIVDDPLVPRGPGSRAFDGEGRGVQRLTVVDKGKLQTFLLDTYSARKLGRKPTGSAGGGGGIPHASTSNFFLLPGKHAPAALLQGIERGLYVERMMGFGFDPTNGNFSRGAEGFLIENGKRTVPVGEITISRNLDELLKGIDRVANDLDHRTATASPSFPRRRDDDRRRVSATRRRAIRSGSSGSRRGRRELPGEAGSQHFSPIVSLLCVPAPLRGAGLGAVGMVGRIDAEGRVAAGVGARARAVVATAGDRHDVALAEARGLVAAPGVAAVGVGGQHGLGSRGVDPRASRRSRCCRRTRTARTRCTPGCRRRPRCCRSRRRCRCRRLRWPRWRRCPTRCRRACAGRARRCCSAGDEREQGERMPEAGSWRGLEGELDGGRGLLGDPGRADPCCERHRRGIRRVIVDFELDRQIQRHRGDQGLQHEVDARMFAGLGDEGLIEVGRGSVQREARRTLPANEDLRGASALQPARRAVEHDVQRHVVAAPAFGRRRVLGIPADLRGVGVVHDVAAIREQAGSGHANARGG
ncbi:MAG: TldD/PmbA family protein [Nannocystaceae bacterium]